MIRAIILTALLMTGVIPAIAQDNNPFSGATSISVGMRRDIDQPINISKSKAKIGHLGRGPVQNDAKYSNSIPRPFRMHCTIDGKPVADWRERAGHYRVRLDGAWSTVPPDAAGPMMVLLWAGGARCR